MPFWAFMILGFAFGWCFSEAYITGPVKHFKRGYKACIDDIIANNEAKVVEPVLRNVAIKLENTK